MRLKTLLQWSFLLLSVVLIAVFLVFSNRLVQSLGNEEHAKMEVWAEAYRQLILADVDADVTLELKVFESNSTIPVFYTDDEGSLLGYSNMEIPTDTATFIADKIRQLTAEEHYFDIEIAPGIMQHLYYDESILLHQLHYYPYVQVMVVIIFALLYYFILLSYRRSEQNRVWVGLSKETAHQLGTPIQSLMGWMEYLSQLGQTDDTGEIADAVTEMNKDIQRLRTVADRFSKIGSETKLEEIDLCPVVKNVVEYMQRRASGRITFDLVMPDRPVMRRSSDVLLSWVVENLCKNAIDAQPTQIKVTLAADGSIEVQDNGKGIAKNRQKQVFQPGYTTKTRGWGLGLTLVRRIIEQYHHGRIFIKYSAPGVGTTFRIEL